MKKGDKIYQQYLDILAEELRPAMGCTEPIALAYAGAKARELLGAEPERVEAWVSGNIIKNVKSVIVPNTGGLCGIAAAVCVGIFCGDADRELQVISSVTEEARAGLPGYIPIAVALVSAVLMAVCGILIKKCKMAWLEQYALPLSMLGAMAASIPITALMG